MRLPEGGPIILFVRRTDAFVHRNVAGEALLIPVGAQPSALQSAYVLNPTAEFVYLKLDGRRDAPELARLLAAAFRADAGTAERDVRELLEALESVGATEPAP